MLKGIDFKILKLLVCAQQNIGLIAILIFQLLELCDFGPYF